MAWMQRLAMTCLRLPYPAIRRDVWKLYTMSWRSSDTRWHFKSFAFRLWSRAELGTVEADWVFFFFALRWL